MPISRPYFSARKRRVGYPLFGLMFAAGAGVNAQQADAPASARAFSIVPSLSVNETLTDNAGLVAQGKQSESITEVTAGLRAASNGGRIRGYFDYALSGLLYANGTRKNGFQNALRASATAEAIENFAYVDVNGTISQQAISAFGTQSDDPRLNNANRTEVASYSVSPYLRGRFLESGEYELRATHSATSSDTGSNFDSKSDDGRLSVSGGSPLAVMTWSANLSHQIVDYTAGSRSKIDQAKLSLDFMITPELRLSVLGGRESNNLVTGETEGKNTYGASVMWQPTERTKVVAGGERRFFGNSHNLSFEHRTPRTVWSFSDTKDVSTGGTNPGSGGSLGTAYDLFFTQLATREPNPVLRQQLILDELRNRGINPTTQLISGFLTSGATLQRVQQLSFALLGLRDTLTFSASRTATRRVDGTSLVPNDPGATGDVRQLSFRIEASHRLTPDSTIDLSVSRLKSSSDEGSLDSTLSTVNLTWTGRISARTRGSVGLRHARFSSASQPYTENALSAAVRFEF